MTEKDFSLRLAKLREEKGVSARDMSLSMGQNPGYINNIAAKCYDLVASKNEAEQKQLYKMLQEMDKYKNQ